MTDPDPVEEANIAAAAIAGFTLAQFAFGELIKNGILPRGEAENLLRQLKPMRLPVREIELRPNYWPSFCKIFPDFSPQPGNRAGVWRPPRPPLS